MLRHLIYSLAIAVLADATTTAQDAQHWPQWRGPLGTGVATNASPPTEWSDTQNVRWKRALPGRGHSSPIVWGDRIFVTAAVGVGPQLAPRMSGRPGAHDNLPIDRAHRFVVIALDRKNGSIVWEKQVHESVPHEGGHNTASLASASPVTDGKHIYAFFGSYGLYCLDFGGNIVWSKHLGEMHTKHGHGEGSSPALHGETLVVNWDHEEQSFLVALDKTSGDQKWRGQRQEVTSWSTPLILPVDGAPQAIVCGTARVRGYELATGKVIWECGGLSANIVATPVAADGILYVGSSYEKRAMMAIELSGARGDITGTDRVLWTRSRGTPYVPSPLLYENALYFLMHYQNVLTRIEAKSGIDSPGAMRLGELGNIYASPVAAAGHVYVTDLNGATQVITHTDVPRPITVNRLNEKVNASLAIVDDEIFIRGETHLYCISQQ